jgi:hypothetical protein
MYISWYINDYGQPCMSSDVNPKISPVHGKIAGSCGVLLATTDLAVLLLLGNRGYRLETREAQLVCPAFDALLVLWPDAFADYLRQHHCCKRLLFA